jgi:REP element-mobilizing transposase RayT
LLYICLTKSMKSQTEMVFRRHGGARRGSGPKKRHRHDISHHARPALDERHPLHVMLRVRRDAPGLRQRHLYHAIRAALRQSAGDPDRGFRVVHMSIQSSHLHLIAEADSAGALSKGMQGLAISAAKRINNALGRHGALFEHRYKAVPLASLTQLRACVLYVVNNWRKHGEDRGYTGAVDWYSTGPQLWPISGPVPEGYAPLPTSPPRTWALQAGWQKLGPIDPFARPGGG